MTNSSVLRERNSVRTNRRISIGVRTTALIISSFALTLAPALANASVESSLAAVQEKLVGTLLPLAAMCGLVFAGLSFVAGHPSARQHLFAAIFGAVVGFGAESIISLVRSLIH